MREVYTISGRVTPIRRPYIIIRPAEYICICTSRTRASVKFSLVNYAVAAPRPKIAAKDVNETINTYYASLNGARGLWGLFAFWTFRTFRGFRVGFQWLGWILIIFQYATVI